MLVLLLVVVVSGEEGVAEMRGVVVNGGRGAAAAVCAQMRGGWEWGVSDARVVMGDGSDGMGVARLIMMGLIAMVMSVSR